MNPPKIDLTNASNVVIEIFDNDQWIKDEFAKYLSSEILSFSEALAESFKYFPQLDSLSSNGDERAAFVAGFIFGVFDDLLVSMKLLVAGKMLASGNLMRQAIEGMAVAILCASCVPISICKQKTLVKIDYWKKLKSRDSSVRSHFAIKQLELNCDALGVSRDAINKLRNAQNHYHKFSHPSLVGMASRMDLGEPGPIYIGGCFDKAKLPAYKQEISERTGLCRVLPNMIEGLVLRLTKNGR